MQDQTINSSVAHPPAEPGAVETAREFLTAVHGSKPDEFFAYIFRLPGKQSFFSRSLDALAAKATAWSDAGSDVYIGMSLSVIDRGAHHRGEAKDAAGISCLWADIDIAGDAHISKTYPPDLDAALELVNAIRFPPSLVVHSGHGVHCYWLFKECLVFDSPEERERAAALEAALHDSLNRAAADRGWRIDQRKDLASVLRVAGTRNYKQAPPADVRVLRGRSS